MRQGDFPCLLQGMKTIQKNLGRSILAVLFIAVSAGRTLAYDHDDKGWFDEHHQHHPFIDDRRSNYIQLPQVGEIFQLISPPLRILNCSAKPAGPNLSRQVIKLIAERPQSKRYVNSWSYF
jgi:hypothetical protein